MISNIFFLDWNENMLAKYAAQGKDCNLHSVYTGDKVKAHQVKKTFNYQIELWKLFAVKI